MNRDGIESISVCSVTWLPISCDAPEMLENIRPHQRGIKSPDVLVHSVRTDLNTGVLSGQIPLRPSDCGQIASVGGTKWCNSVFEGAELVGFSPLVGSRNRGI